MLYLSAFLGDSTTLAIPLSWQGSAFSPGEDWTLIFSAKSSPADEDSSAVFQKSTGAGITVAHVTASIAMVPADTVDLSAGSLAFDIQAQETATGAIRTVAIGWLSLTRDITRKTTTSVPVHTTEEPTPIGTPLPAWLAAFTSIAVVDERLVITTTGGDTYDINAIKRP